MFGQHQVSRAMSGPTQRTERSAFLAHPGAIPLLWLLLVWRCAKRGLAKKPITVLLVWLAHMANPITNLDGHGCTTHKLAVAYAL